MKVRKVLTRLREDGWVLKNQVGSHMQFVHPEKKGKVTIANQKGEIPKGTLNSIFKQAGWK